VGREEQRPEISRIVSNRFPDYLERIRTLCRQPSVSATGEGIGATAEMVLGLIEDAGGRARLVETPGHPVVLGEISGPPGGPTLTRYGMYDVQPAEEDTWSAPPFAAEILDLPGAGEAVVGRGTANSKGSLASFFCALDAMREMGDIPVGLRFVIEGEEELGSPHLADVVRSNEDQLRSDAGVDFDLCGNAESSSAELILGCKGLLGLELSCAGGDWGGPTRSLHSSEAAWIASPVWMLVRALASLVGSNEELLLPELVSRSAKPSDADRRLLDDLAAGFDPRAHLAEAHAGRYKVEGSARELLERLIFSATANISGLAAGYTGEASKTIIPSYARANLDIRLVPGLDEDLVTEALRRHLDELGFGPVSIRVTDSYPWAKSDPSSGVALAMRASYEAMGRRSVAYPMAPWCAPFYVFDRVLGLPWASGGLGFSGGAHGPDEFATVSGLRDHIEGVVAFLHAFAHVEGASGPARERGAA
jgi:acetylornithine deacetylase/succinyl-diaminopimelate desuccinylase-like protein